MVVGIIYNASKQIAEDYCIRLVEEFRERNVKTVVSSKKNMEDKVFDEADVIISVGGDGTLLKVAVKALERGIPVFGFNLGTIGFLTEFEKNSFFETIDKIAGKEYDIEEHNVLDVYLETNGERKFLGYALNDAVITRDVEANVCYLLLKINGQKVGTYPSDGIIVATQTGSTAYSLSAGGPIIEPGNDVNVITPICSHRMGSRSIVARSTSRIEITPVIKAKKMKVILDGNRCYSINEKDSIICETSEKKVRIIRIDPPNFYHTVSTKLFREEDIPGGDY